MEEERFLIDMTHDNPGEDPFETKFRNPFYLSEIGYNGKVLWHCFDLVLFNLAPAVRSFSPSVTSEIISRQMSVDESIVECLSAGMDAWLCGDLFTLPVSQRDDAKFCPGRQSDWDIVELSLMELVIRYPEVKGFIFRMGEQYTHSSPWLVGSGPLDCGCSCCSMINNIERWKMVVRFLEDVVCKRLNKYCILRTWDLGEKGLHANKKFQEEVVSALDGDEKIILSSKMSQTDYWRYQPWNDSLNITEPARILECQCQREYEFKGLIPNWLGPMLAEGSIECGERGVSGLAHRAPPNWAGVLTWSRGGGWGGPHPVDELWIGLNVWSAATLAKQPNSDLTEILETWLAKERFEGEGTEHFATLLKESEGLVLALRYLETYRKVNPQTWIPSENWLRDDIIQADALAKLTRLILAANKGAELLIEREEAIAIAANQHDRARKLFDEGGLLSHHSKAGFILDSYQFAHDFAIWSHKMFEFLLENQLTEREFVASVLGEWMDNNPMAPFTLRP